MQYAFGQIYPFLAHSFDSDRQRGAREPGRSGRIMCALYQLGHRIESPNDAVVAIAVVTNFSY